MKNRLVHDRVRGPHEQLQHEIVWVKKTCGHGMPEGPRGRAVWRRVSHHPDTGQQLHIQWTTANPPNFDLMSSPIKFDPGT